MARISLLVSYGTNLIVGQLWHESYWRASQPANSQPSMHCTMSPAAWAPRKWELGQAQVGHVSPTRPAAPISPRGGQCEGGPCELMCFSVGCRGGSRYVEGCWGLSYLKIELCFYLYLYFFIFLVFVFPFLFFVSSIFCFISPFHCYVFCYIFTFSMVNFQKCRYMGFQKTSNNRSLDWQNWCFIQGFHNFLVFLRYFCNK